MGFSMGFGGFERRATYFKKLGSTRKQFNRAESKQKTWGGGIGRRELRQNILGAAEKFHIVSGSRE